MSLTCTKKQFAWPNHPLGPQCWSCWQFYLGSLWSMMGSVALWLAAFWSLWSFVFRETPHSQGHRPFEVLGSLTGLQSLSMQMKPLWSRPAQLSSSFSTTLLLFSKAQVSDAAFLPDPPPFSSFTFVFLPLPTFSLCKGKNNFSV